MKTGPQLEHPLGKHDHRCLLLRGFLSTAECAALLDAAKQRGFRSAEANYPPSYRNNQRLVFEDPQLAGQLLLRLRHLLPQLETDGAWSLDAINPHWRSCRYAPGQAFHIHQDGVYNAPDGRCSRLTFMLYLNDASEFDGGETVFFDGPPDRDSPPNELARVRPSAGALIVFDHTLWHAGSEVTGGLKTILRSDLLYRHAQPAVDHEHRGYVFCLVALDSTRFLSGGRDGTIRLNQTGQASRIVGRHAQSVLGLHSLSTTRFAAISRDQCLGIHDLSGTASKLDHNAHAGAVLCVTGDETRLYTGGADHQIGVWDLEGQSLTRLHGLRGWVWGLVVLDPRRLCSASEDRRVVLWIDGRVAAELTMAQPLRAVLFNAATEQLVVADSAGELHLLDLAQGRLQLRFSVSAHSAQIRRLRHRANGLLSCAEDGRICSWNWKLESTGTVARRDGFVTDALQLRQQLISAGYQGGVQRHELD